MGKQNPTIASARVFTQDAARSLHACARPLCYMLTCGLAASSFAFLSRSLFLGIRQLLAFQLHCLAVNHAWMPLSLVIHYTTYADEPPPSRMNHSYHSLISLSSLDKTQPTVTYPQPVTHLQQYFPLLQHATFPTWQRGTCPRPFHISLAFPLLSLGYNLIPCTVQCIHPCIPNRSIILLPRIIPLPLQLYTPYNTY